MTTTKARETAAKTESSAADEKAPAEQTKQKAEPAKGRKDPRACVVDDGTAHVGRATPGARICSAHAMRYKADGTPR